MRLPAFNLFRLPVLALAWVGLVLAGDAGAEEVRTRFWRDVVVGSELHFQLWSGESDLEVREFSIPFVFVVPLGRRLSLDLVTGSGLATLDQDESSDLKGLTDTKIRASCILGDELLLLTAGVSTPTGKTELDEEEQEVSNFLSQDGLDFRTSTFGQGLDLNVGLALAYKLGETVFGLGAGYLRKGEYLPQDGEPEYQPGDELSLTAGLDREVMDSRVQLTLDATYTRYGGDRQEGERVFQSGNKVLVQALGRFRAGIDWQIHLSGRIKGRSTSYTLAEEETEYTNGNQFEGGLAAMVGGVGPLRLRGVADLKFYEDNEFDRGEVTIWGVGPGFRLRLAPGTFVDLNARYSRGHIDAADVTGIDLSGGVWIKL